jgi:hypothetical protein
MWKRLLGRIRRRESDEEIIVRLRKFALVRDRQRKWLVGLHVFLFLLIVGLAFGMAYVVSLVMQMGVNIGQNGQKKFNAGLGLFGLGFGACLGLNWGLLFIHNLHTLLNLLGSDRQIRLLLQYHDALQAIVTTDRTIPLESSGVESHSPDAQPGH